MENLVKQIETHKAEISAFAESDAEVFRIKYLGTKGLVKAVMGEMKNVAAENKKQAGQLLNEFKLFAEARFEASSKRSTRLLTRSATQSRPKRSTQRP